MNKIIGHHTRAVIFDFDDTLIGTHESIWNLHKHIAHKYYDIELTDDVMALHWGQPLPTLAKEYYQTDLVDDAIQRMIDHQFDFPKKKFESTEKVINKLHESKILTGIVSATTRNILIKDAELSHIPHEKLDYIQTAEDTLWHKPDPRVFRPLLQWALENSIHKNELLYVGDGLQDYEAAKKAGINFIGVTTGLVTAEQFKINSVTYIKNLVELVKND